MKLTFSLFAISCALQSSSVSAADGTTRNLKSSKSAKLTKSEKSGKKRSKSSGPSVPEIGSLMDKAFPMWEVDADGRRVDVVDADGRRVETTACTPDSCEWNPHYITKRYDGLHPDYGGHPTDFDVKYAFYYSSPFAGQPYSGTPHHCDIDDNDDIKIGDCPKIKTMMDNGPYGPGHVPPHIALAALTEGTEDKLYKLEDIFDYEFYDCRVVPDVLLKLIRHYYPRVDGEVVMYPPPITEEGGDFQYEFPSGNGIENQEPPYKPGPPHWCTSEFQDTGHWDGVCPYVFKGTNAGKYRHPHIAYAALEVHLANIAMPDKCATTWLENNPDFIANDHVTTDTPFPEMDADDNDSKTLENWLGQPVLPWNYNSGDAKDVKGVFAQGV